MLCVYVRRNEMKVGGAIVANGFVEGKTHVYEKKSGSGEKTVHTRGRSWTGEERIIRGKSNGIGYLIFRFVLLQSLSVSDEIRMVEFGANDFLNLEFEAYFSLRF